MRIDYTWAVLVIGLFCAGITWAQTSPAPAPQAPAAASTPIAAAQPARPAQPAPVPEKPSAERLRSERHFEEIERYNEQTQRYEAVIRMLQKQREKVALDEEISRAQGNNTQGVRGMPALVGVTGSDRLTAKLQYGDGSFVMASDGDRLPSGLRVVSVKPRHIVLSEGKSEVVLPLLFSRADKVGSGASQAMPPRIMASPVDSAGPIIGRNPAPAQGR